MLDRTRPLFRGKGRFLLIPAILCAGFVLVIACIFIYDLSLNDIREANTHGNAAMGRIEEGMTLSEAENLLQDAWQTIQCPSYRNTTRRLYLYGRQNFDRSSAVILRTERKDGQEIITGVFFAHASDGFDIGPELTPHAYSWCLR